MIVEDTRLYTFQFHSEPDVLEFIWKEATQDMQDEDFKEALRAFTIRAAEKGATHLLVDLRPFRHKMNKELGAWRDTEISPLYNKAGIKRFAYILPAGAPGTPESEPDKRSPGEEFYTRFFTSEDAAHSWVGMNK